MGRVVRASMLLATDAAALLLAAGAAYVVWALPVRGQPAGVYAGLAPLVFLFLLGYSRAGLYPGFGVGPVETLRRFSYVTGFGFLVLAAFSFGFKLSPLYSRATFSIAFVFSLVLVPASRALVSHWASRWSWWHEPVVIVGTGERAAGVIRSIRTAGLGYRPEAVVSLQPEATGQVEGVPIAGGVECAPALAAEGIRVAFVETRRADPSRERPVIDRLQRHFRHVVLLREYDDLPVEGLQVRNLGTLVGVEYTNNLLREGNRVIKRAMDIAIGAVALAVAAPIIAAAAALVRVLDGSPAFFLQDRAGLDGRRIAVSKIRTMRRGAEQQLEAHLAANPDARREWEAKYKLTNDPRLIPVIGGMFRRYSVDELPQLWAVLRGDMSLVGPRPFPDYHLEGFSPAFRELRRRVRPGITGLWQITVRSAGSTREQESYDSYYIRNWSVWLDVHVLCRTIGAVLSGRGAY
ncbi:MAG TPA: exopolysaccharide biosynthesis polyprenyl glycosylphosphotransferase [Vicinamibacterales bacterium]|nr:exopolysaccharide biosynthesis polyprenyl glycosylphosphotransferase [Vicinamibacterales bacterium]